MRRSSVAVFVAACLLAALVPLLPAQPVSHATSFPGWPARYEGRPLRELPLTALERRFEENFPGRLGRFTDGEREVVIRWVSRETRKLHPAADCFKSSGFRVTPRPLEVDAAGARWGSFVAVRGRQTVRVRERIHDAAGDGWADVSSWYWAAMLGKSSGPWWAVTIAVAEKPE